MQVYKQHPSLVAFSTLRYFVVSNRKTIHIVSEMEVSFSPTSFAEGRFRRAYMGEYTKPRHKAGCKCVVKEKKDSYVWEQNGWDEEKKIYGKASELAGTFNTNSGTSRPIKFTEILTGKVTACSTNTTPKVGEWCIVEDYIPGDYQKFCNNYGYIAEGNYSLQGFMHWSWNHTQGEIMVADLQGVRNNDNYYLTDPVLLSGTVSGGVYGNTDMGIEGIGMFFLNHKCNQFCNTLPKPRIQGPLSPSQISATIVLQRQLTGSTAYSHELVLPEAARKTLVQAFRRIAQT